MPSDFQSRIVECGQLSPEWLKLRCGKVTASDAWKVMDRLKNGKSSAQRQTYLAQKVAETLTNNAAEHYVSYYMDRGREFQPQAIQAAEIKTGHLIQQVGFVRHPRIERCGCSPDGLIVDISEPSDPKLTPNGLEVKCCQNHIHLQNMGILPGLELIEGVPADFVPQMDLCMACCDSEYWNFVSYHPDMPAHLQCYIKPLYRNEKREAALEYAILEFLAEMDELLAKLNYKPEPIIDRTPQPDQEAGLYV